MKNLLMFCVLSIGFIACGDDKKEVITEVEKTFTCKEIFNEEYLKEYHKSPLSEVTPYFNQGTCAFAYTVNDEQYNASVIVGLTDGGTKEMLEQSVATFHDKKPLENLGEKAYIYPAGGAYQISILGKHGSLIHLFMYKDGTDERQMMIDIGNDMLKKLSER